MIGIVRLAWARRGWQPALMIEEEPGAYEVRVANAVMRAVFDTSVIEFEGKSRAYIRTTEACAALITVLATLMEGSPPCRTPRGLRQTAAAVGEETLRSLRDLRAQREATGVPPLGSDGIAVN